MKQDVWGGHGQGWNTQTPELNQTSDSLILHTEAKCTKLATLDRLIRKMERRGRWRRVSSRCAQCAASVTQAYAAAICYWAAADRRAVWTGCSLLLTMLHLWVIQGDSAAVQGLLEVLGAACLLKRIINHCSEDQKTRARFGSATHETASQSLANSHRTSCL